MADENQDESQKTEEPTQKKLDDAHEKGQIIFSKEVTNFAVFTAISMCIIFLFPSLSVKALSISKYIEHSHHIILDGYKLKQMMQEAFKDLFAIILIPALAIVSFSILSSLMQTGGLLISTDPITPKLSKISPLAGLKRMFSLRSVSELVKGIIKMIIVGGCMYVVVKPELSSLKMIHQVSTKSLINMMYILITRMLYAVCIIMFFIAILDYMYQKYEFMKNMKMSKQDIKDEYKQTEGNPEIKAKIRSLRMNKIKSNIAQAVPTADVVITNPTHYGIAIKYDENTMNAPVVVAKGVDNLVPIIKQIAKDHQVPIVENPPLARSLYDNVEVNEEIPEQHYRAVAEVISYVFNLKNGKKNKKAKI